MGKNRVQLCTTKWINFINNVGQKKANKDIRGEFRDAGN